jgi:hypothetical protein
LEQCVAVTNAPQLHAVEFRPSAESQNNPGAKAPNRASLESIKKTAGKKRNPPLGIPAKRESGIYEDRHAIARNLPDTCRTELRYNITSKARF